MSPSEKTKMNNRIKCLEAAVARLQECNSVQKKRIEALEKRKCEQPKKAFKA